uniref:Uncharacterized protein n=1 Tax=Globodera rostochiensis TaxID=31243 RepID=A0A914HF47_GLORO
MCELYNNTPKRGIEPAIRSLLQVTKTGGGRDSGQAGAANDFSSFLVFDIDRTRPTNDNDDDGERKSVHGSRDNVRQQKTGAQRQGERNKMPSGQNALLWRLRREGVELFRGRRPRPPPPPLICSPVCCGPHGDGWGPTVVAIGTVAH